MLVVIGNTEKKRHGEVESIKQISKSVEKVCITRVFCMHKPELSFIPNLLLPKDLLDRQNRIAFKIASIKLVWTDHVNGHSYAEITLQRFSRTVKEVSTDFNWWPELI